MAGNYAIDEDGRVLSHYKNGYMKTKIDKDGYTTICLVTNNGKRSSFGIHRLLMVTFKPCDDMDNHIDGNKKNNSLSNLEWVTNSENIHLVHVDGLTNTIGEHHRKARITDAEAAQIISMLKEGKALTK